mmetsp:Transcript_42820/g.77371  ORF Transcript_42820/g.77371 Transcript_42820/m.77371 type:complete len:244 (+) Transcript_42820:860-1591(+)
MTPQVAPDSAVCPYFIQHQQGSMLVCKLPETLRELLRRLLCRCRIWIGAPTDKNSSYITVKTPDGLLDAVKVIVRVAHFELLALLRDDSRFPSRPLRACAVIRERASRFLTEHAALACDCTCHHPRQGRHVAAILREEGPSNARPQIHEALGQLHRKGRWPCEQLPNGIRSLPGRSFYSWIVVAEHICPKSCEIVDKLAAVGVPHAAASATGKKLRECSPFQKTRLLQRTPRPLGTRENAART